MAADAWDGAEAYEAFMGRWSRRLAPRFLEWARVPPRGTVLDVGSGTGALAAACLEAGASRVVGADASPTYARHAAGQLAAHRGAAFVVADARRLPVPADRFDAAVSALVLNFVPDPHRAVAEMARATRPGGVVAACVWDYADGMGLLRHFWDAAIHLDLPGARDGDEGARFPICDPARLANAFESAGLRDVHGGAVEVVAEFPDFEDYWRPFLGGQGPAPGYVAALPAGQRLRLRDHLRDSVPTDARGRVRFPLRAFAARGAP